MQTMLFIHPQTNEEPNEFDSSENLFVAQGSKGFTLVETMVAMTIASLVGVTVLMNVFRSLESTENVVDSVVAQGMACQLLDEVSLAYFQEPGTVWGSGIWGAEAGEKSGVRRDLFDDLDDFDSYSATPPCDRWGIALGTEDSNGKTRPVDYQIQSKEFIQWRQEIIVRPVAEADFSVPLALGTSSRYRRVEVRIIKNDPVLGDRELAKVSQVFAYAPTP